MADQDYEIYNKISWDSDDSPLQEAGSRLEELATKAAKLAAAYLSVREAIQFVRDAFKEAVEEEKLFTQLTENAKLLAGATEEVADSLKDWVLDLQKVSGVSVGQLVPAMNQTISATRDINRAQQLMEIAAGAAARGIGTLESNVTTLARAIQTGNIRGVGPFQNLLREALKTTGDLSGAVDDLAKKFEDAGAAVETTAMKLERAKNAFRETKSAIGDMVLEAGGGAKGGLLKALSFGLAMVADTVLTLTGYVVGLAKVLGDLGRVLFHLIPGFVDLQKIQDALSDSTSDFADTVNKFGKISSTMYDKVVAAWSNWAGSIGKVNSELQRGLEAYSKLSKSLNEHADIAEKRMEEEDEAWAKHVKLLDEGAKHQIEVAKQVAEQELKYIDDVNAANERLNKEQASREAQEENRAISAANKIAKIEQELAYRKKAINSQELRWKIAELEEAYEEERALGIEDVNLATYIANLKIKLDKLVHDEKVESDLDWAARAASAAASMFKQNKALNLAAAIVAAFAGAAKAGAMMAEFGPWAAAAAYMETLAQLWNAVTGIEGTDMGSGAGGGGGGTMGAAVGPMVYTGAPAAPTAGPTTNVQSTVNQPSSVTINTLTGDGAVATARAVQRILRPGSRAYDRGVVNRQALTIGSTRR